MTTLIEKPSSIKEIYYNLISFGYDSHNPIIKDISIPKSYRLPNNLNTISPKERRNKKRILEHDRDISPFSNYYQN